MDWADLPHSSHVKRAGYDSATRELHLTFADGSTYAHEGVPREVFDGLAASPSPGSYFRRHVKGKYRHRPV